MQKHRMSLLYSILYSYKNYEKSWTIIFSNSKKSAKIWLSLVTSAVHIKNMKNNEIRK